MIMGMFFITSVITLYLRGEATAAEGQEAPWIAIWRMWMTMVSYTFDHRSKIMIRLETQLVTALAMDQRTRTGSCIAITIKMTMMSMRKMWQQVLGTKMVDIS